MISSSRLRLEAAASLLTREDVVIVSSVSCIYGFGEPASFEGGSLVLEVESRKQETGDRRHEANEQIVGPRGLAQKLIDMRYERNDLELKSGRFRVRGDVVDIVQGSGTTFIRVSFFWRSD